MLVHSLLFSFYVYFLCVQRDKATKEKNVKRVFKTISNTQSSCVLELKKGENGKKLKNKLQVVCKQKMLIKSYQKDENRFKCRGVEVKSDLSFL